MASHHHSCCRWLVASRCPCEPFEPVIHLFIVPAHLVTEDIIFRTKPPLAPLCLMVGPNSRVVCEFNPAFMMIVEDVSDQFATCDECCEGIEACCLKGLCLDLPPAECVAMGGVPQGKGTQCIGIKCPEAEACCLPDGSCINVLPAICLAAEGVPQGPGTQCVDPNIDCELPPGPCPTGTGCTETCPQTIAVSMSGAYVFCSDLLLHHGPPCDEGCMANEWAAVIPGHRGFVCGWVPDFFLTFPTCFGHDRFVYGSIFCFPNSCNGLPCWKVEMGILIHHEDSDSITASAKWFFEKPTTDPQQCMRGGYTLVGTEGFAPIGSTIQVLAGSLTIT